MWLVDCLNNMTELIHTQLDMAIISLIIGALMGFSYDIIRIFRRMVSHNLFFVSLEDVIYWFIWTIITLDKIYTYNYGMLRIYIIIGLLMGFIIYRYTIGWVLIKFTDYMLCTVKKLLKKAKNMLKNIVKKGNI